MENANYEFLDVTYIVSPYLDFELIHKTALKKLLNISGLTVVNSL